jgi:cytochrome oxidase assembly protein ShyY1
VSDWRRVVTTLAVGALVATACTLLGLWQWHRHVARSAAVAAVQAAWDAPVLPLDALLTSDGRPADGSVWHRAQVSGTYLTAARTTPAATVLLRNRPVDGGRGFHVLEPLLVADGPWAGHVLLVDRGWLPGGRDAETVPPVPAPPVGRVDVVVRVRALEARSSRSAPAGQVQSIDLASARAASAADWSQPDVTAYGQAVTEDGAAPVGLGALARPSTDLGPHLSYAFQWWVFATGSLVGAVVLLRRGDRAPAPRRRGSAEQEEDALLDAQERAVAPPGDR